MPFLKLVPEPKFIRDGRTKVFEVDTFRIGLMNSIQPIWYDDILIGDKKRKISYRLW